MHGLTDEFLADKPLFAAIADELLEFVAGAEIVIHNAAFDVGFLNAELRRLARPDFAGQVAQRQRQPADGARDVSRQIELARRAVPPPGGRQQQPHVARRAARRRPAGRGLSAHDARPGLAGDRRRRRRSRPRWRSHRSTSRSTGCASSRPIRPNSPPTPRCSPSSTRPARARHAGAPSKRRLWHNLPLRAALQRRFTTRIPGG